MILAQLRSNKVSREIHPNCEMFRYAKLQLQNDVDATNYYFQSAEFLLTRFYQLLKELDVQPCQKTILDFACGYGRLTRHFVSNFEAVTASDLEQEMMDFVSRELGCSTFLSDVDGSRVRKHNNKYDIVFCFSLFTHLNGEIWGQWFDSLFNLVNEHGLFIISAHGHDLFRKIDPNFDERHNFNDLNNFVFWETNETYGRLPTNYYGCNVINENFIRNHISNRSNITLLKHYEMGEFDLYHDVYIFQKRNGELQ